MTTTYIVEIVTPEGSQSRRITADGYKIDIDSNILSLFVMDGGSRNNIALFSGDKWICVREQYPYQHSVSLSSQVGIMGKMG